MHELNLARAKRLFKKADKFEPVVNSDDVSVEQTWGVLTFIDAMRKDISAIAENEPIPVELLVAECTNNARRYLCIWLFKRTRDETSLPFLAEQLSSGHRHLVPDAVDAIAGIGTKSARSILEGFCSSLTDEDDDLTAEYARKALATFSYDEIPSHIREQLNGDLPLALNGLKNVASLEATDLLIQHLDSKDNRIRLAAFAGLESRDEQEVSAQLVDYLFNGRAQTKLDSLKLLSKFSSDELVLTICSVMRHGNSNKLRGQAALTVGSMKNPTAIEHLLNALGDPDEHPNVIASVCVSLKKFECTKAIPRILEILETMPFGTGEIQSTLDSNLYDLATKTLHSLADKTDSEIFAKLLNHRLATVRLNAMHALRQRKQEASYVALATRLAVEKDKTCIGEIERSLKALRKFAPVATAT